jgi:cellulose synthase/poly-beta-1,6-N-acetylglucosamine synthase-like glycosyltransferase
MIVIYSLLLILLLTYIVALMVLLSGLHRLRRKEPPDDLPFISVIVSAHNEEKNIGACLKHLAAQRYPDDKIEFIVVDDRSKDRTMEIIDTFISRDSRFQTISIQDRLPDFAPKKRAIDAAISKAQGSIIIHTDADGRPGPEWVRYMAACFSEDIHMVIGYAPYHISRKHRFVSRILALEYLSHAAVAAATTGLGYPLTCVGTNLAYRKKLYRGIGGFGKFKPFISGDDDLFLTRVRGDKRYKIGYAVAPETHVYNNPPSGFMKFFHQRMRYASKGFYYQPEVTITLIGYYLMNALLLFGSFLSVTGLVSLPFMAGALASKVIVEAVFMSKAAHLLGDKRSISLLLPASLLHIPYVVLFGIMGQFNYFKWAEGRAEKAVQQYASQ